MKPEIYKGHVITYKCGYYWGLGVCRKTLKGIKTLIDKVNGEFHPCTCTDYNGEQCYNCLNGFHEGCTGNCKLKNAKQMGINLIFK